MTQQTKKRVRVRAQARIKGKALYKLFASPMESPFGSNLKWSLPSGSRPGAWQVHDGPLLMCVSGLHVVVGSEGVRAFKVLSFTDRVFRVEVAGVGEIRGPETWRRHDRRYTKAVCSHVRLVREIRRGSPQWKKLKLRR